MSEKEFERLSKSLLILWEGVCEDCRLTSIGSRIVMDDAPEPEGEEGTKLHT